MDNSTTTTTTTTSVQPSRSVLPSASSSLSADVKGSHRLVALRYSTMTMSMMKAAIALALALSLFTVGETKMTQSFIPLALAQVVLPSSNATEKNKREIVIGYFRIPSDDSPDFLAGALAAVKSANDAELAGSEHEFVLAVYNYPHCTMSMGSVWAPDAMIAKCDTTNSTKLSSGIAEFVGNITRFHAILRPFYTVSDLIISAAAAEGISLISSTNTSASKSSSNNTSSSAAFAKKASKRTIPIIDPMTLATSHYSTEQFQNIFMISSQQVSTEVAVIVRYMFTAHSCARSGVVYERGLPNIESHTKIATDAFLAGGFAAPELLAVDSGSSDAAATLEFFYGDADRMCFLMLTSGWSSTRQLVTLITDPRYVLGERKIFMWSYLAKTLAGSAAAALAELNLTPVSGVNTGLIIKLAGYMYFPAALPSVSSAPPRSAAAFRKAYEALLGDNASMTVLRNQLFFSPSEHLQTYVPLLNSSSSTTSDGDDDDDETMLTAPTTSAETTAAAPSLDAFHAFLVMMYPLTVLGRLAPYHDLQSNVPATWKLFLDSAYDSGVTVGGDFPLARGIRSCLPAPLTRTTCDCNTVNRFAYIYALDGSKKDPTPLEDVTVSSYGEDLVDLIGGGNGDDGATAAIAGTTSLSIASDLCTLTMAAEDFPLSMMLLTTSESAETPVTAGGYLLSELLRTFTAQQNSNVKSSGRRRIISMQYPDTVLTDEGEEYSSSSSGASIVAANEYLLMASRRYEPFVILSSDAPVNDTTILTFAASGVSNFPLSDPVLTSRETWNEHIALFMPSFADYVHAMVDYYAAKMAADPKVYTGRAFLANTVEAAEIVIKSLHTYQIRATLDDFMISDDPVEWSVRLFQVVASYSTNPRPFILAAVSGKSEIMASVAATMLSAMASNLLTFPADQFITFAACGADGRLDAFDFSNSAHGALLVDNVIFVFASVFSEWWMPDNALRTMLKGLGGPMDRVGHQASYYLSTMGYLVANHLGSMRSSTASTAAQVLYTARTASFADIPLGPFSNDTCSDEIVAANEVDRTCQCNKAFRLFRIHSINDWAKTQLSYTTGQYVYQMTTCGVQYKPFVEPVSLLLNSNDNAATIGIAVGVSCGVFAVVLVLILVYVFCFAGRNNTNAPKDASVPFTLVFTDIQASTTLWSRAPTIMNDAVEHHCLIIRRIISKCNGYEVKTIGDSFMVAFKAVEDAVKFSVELQVALYRDEGWPEDVDQHYREILETAAYEATFEETQSFNGGGKGSSFAQAPPGVLSSSTANNSGSVSPPHLHLAAPPNAPHNAQEYAAAWHGIRVRVGVHYGHGEIRKDPITHGYDYYGTVVNTAARVEGVGHGGQVLVTDAVLTALGQGFVNSQGWSQITLGPQLLRGLDDKISLSQLLPTELSTRRFPPLRLDVEKTVDDGTDSNMMTDSLLNASLTANGLELLAFGVYNETVHTSGGAAAAAQQQAQQRKEKKKKAAQQQQQHDTRKQEVATTTSPSVVDSAAADILLLASASPHASSSNLISVVNNTTTTGSSKHNRHHQTRSILNKALASSTTTPTAAVVVGGGGGPMDFDEPSQCGSHSTGEGSRDADHHNHHHDHHAAAAAPVNDLLHQYNFLSSLFATSTESWRQDTLKHLAKRWRVKGSTVGATLGFSDGSEAASARTMLQVVLKAMLAQKGGGFFRSNANASPNANPNTTLKRTVTNLTVSAKGTTVATNANATPLHVAGGGGTVTSSATLLPNFVTVQPNTTSSVFAPHTTTSVRMGSYSKSESNIIPKLTMRERVKSVALTMEASADDGDDGLMMASPRAIWESDPNAASTSGGEEAAHVSRTEELPIGGI